MNSRDDLNAAEAALRSSIEAEAFTDIASLLERYAAAVVRELAGKSPAAVPPLRDRVLRFLDWAATMARASRNCSSDELVRLRLTSSYAGPLHASRGMNASA